MCTFSQAPHSHVYPMCTNRHAHLQAGTVLTWVDILRAIADIANGCLYLSNTGFVHCDLATRNIFLGTVVATQTF